MDNKKNMNMIRTILLICLFFLSGNTFAGIKFGELTNNCKTAVQLAEAHQDAPIKKDLHAAMLAEKCWTYLNSFQEALAWSAIKKASQNQPEPDMKTIMQHLPFCIPDSVTLKQQALMLINHAERNPAHQKWPAGAVVGEIMLKLYPCGQ